MTMRQWLSAVNMIFILKLRSDHSERSLLNSTNSASMPSVNLLERYFYSRTCKIIVLRIFIVLYSDQ